MQPKILGHRGSPFEAPENTISSVKKAIAAGVDAVEIDVHQTKDNHIVVIHDDKVDRTTNGKGYVKEFTLNNLQQLKIKYNDKNTDEKIPLLQEIIDLTKNKIKLTIEIKEKNIENNIVEIIEKNNIVDNIYVISFFHKIVKNIKKINNKIKTSILFVGYPINVSELAINANADALSINYHYIDNKLVEEAHKNNLKVFVWNIDTIEDLKEILKLNVDVIGSNKPELILDYFKKKL